MEEKNVIRTIDEYISQFPAEIQEILHKLRKVIKAAAPDAEERMSWQMPTFYLKGNLVHFAAYKKHIGFYPGESGISNFINRFKEYKSSKGAVQFPIDKPLPFELISEIVKFRVSENLKDAELKAQTKKKVKE